MKDLRTGQDLFHEFYQDDVLCEQCRKKLKMHRVSFYIEQMKVESYCAYQDDVKQCLLQYKEFYDEALYPVFFYTIAKSIRKKYRNYEIILIPSSSQRVKERGFDHLERMCSVIGLPMHHVLVNESSEQQKYLTRLERRKHSGQMRLVQELPLNNYLLIDDMVTTGSTLLMAYRLVKPYAKKIAILTFAYGMGFQKK